MHGKISILQNEGYWDVTFNLSSWEEASEQLVNVTSSSGHPAGVNLQFYNMTYLSSSVWLCIPFASFSLLLLGIFLLSFLMSNSHTSTGPNAFTWFISRVIISLELWAFLVYFDCLQYLHLACCSIHLWAAYILRGQLTMSSSVRAAFC